MRNLKFVTEQKTDRWTGRWTGKQINQLILEYLNSSQPTYRPTEIQAKVIFMAVERQTIQKLSTCERFSPDGFVVVLTQCFSTFSVFGNHRFHGSFMYHSIPIFLFSFLFSFLCTSHYHCLGLGTRYFPAIFFSCVYETLHSGPSFHRDVRSFGWSVKL